MRKQCWIMATGLSLLLAIGGAALAWEWMQQRLDTPMSLPADGVVRDVRPGQSVRSVFRALVAEGLLTDDTAVRWYLRVSRRGHRIMAGEYRLTPGLTPRQLLEKLEHGDVIVRQVTLPEGLTVREMLAVLHAAPRLKAELTSPAAVAVALGLPATPHAAEGWVFPDTYRYRAGMSDRALVTTAHQRMQAVLTGAWAQRAPDLPYRTPYEALIMASLVEKETAVGSERQAIAGVFVRRLRRGMRLQTDPSVIYGLGPDFDGNLTRRHLRTPNPYNTYMNHGLPPTPIAAPGAAAIHAALHPASGDALYFVARGDGTHVFSDTLAEHRAAVQRYQVRERATRYRSTPGTTAESP